MPVPIIVLNCGVDLPFMRTQEEEFDEQEEDVADEDPEEPTSDEVLEQMQAAIPADAKSLGTLEYHLDHSPGLSWKIEDHFYLVPLQGEKYEWALIRITWDDNYGRYQWAEDAVGSGFGDARAAARAMVAAVLKSWGTEDEGVAADAQREFLEKL